MPNQNIQPYENRTYHGGVNSRIHGRLIADNEATDLVNADISVPFQRTKRKEKSLVTTLLNATVPPTPTSLSVDIIVGAVTTNYACGSAIALHGATPAQSITLKWGAITGAESYLVRLYSGLVCGGVATELPISAENPSYPFSSDGLAVGNYSWTVQAIGDGNTYADSNVSACCSFRVEDGAAVPSSCPGGLLSTYTLSGGPVISGTTNSGTVPSPSCDAISTADASASAAWDGIYTLSSSCLWRAPDGVQSWLGKRLQQGSSVPTLRRFTSGGFHYWEVVVPISEGAQGRNVQYIKAYGLTPVGTYTITCSGGSPTTLVIS